MNETRIALAFVVLGLGLLAATFAYLAYDGAHRGPGADGAKSTATAAAAPSATPGEGPGAPTEADGPEAAGAEARSIQAGGGEPVPAENAPPPSAGKAPAPDAPHGPVRSEEAVAAAQHVVPAYDAPVGESQAEGVTEIVVGTDATGEDEMRLVASDLASYYPNAGVLLVDFRERTSGGAYEPGRETGFAMVFGSREAALAPDLKYTREEVDEIFEDEGGIRAVSYADFERENPSLKDDLARISSS